MSEFAGKVCPFCKTPVTADEEVVVCPACRIPHHKGCWNENRGCTTFGCSELHYEPQGTNISDVCAKCGTPLGDGQEFCSKCGVRKGAPPANVCGKCGATLQEGHEFCSKCGQKAGLALDLSVAAAINQANASVIKKQKKKIVIPIVAAVVVVVVVAVALIGAFVNNTIQAKKLTEATDAYIADAKVFNLQVSDSAVKLETVGNKMQTYWNNYIWKDGIFIDGSDYVVTSSVTDAVAQAQQKTSTELRYIKTHDDDIQRLYKSLQKVPDKKNEDLLNIKEAVKAMYDEYMEMYNCVVNPNGNYNSWTSDFSDADSALLKRWKVLSSLLEDYE